MERRDFKIEIPRNCNSCENVKIIDGKMYCTRFSLATARPLEVSTLSGDRNLNCCPLLSAQKKRGETLTNADKIKNMSDEELAKFLEEVENLGYCDDSIAENLDMLEWLQREVDES